MARGGSIHRRRLSIRTYGERNPMISFMIVLCIFGIFGFLCQLLHEKERLEWLWVISSLLWWGMIPGRLLYERMKELAIKNKWHLTFYFISMAIFGTMASYVLLKCYRYSGIRTERDSLDLPTIVWALCMVTYISFVGVFFYSPLSLLLRGIIRNWAHSSGYTKRYWCYFRTIFKAHSNVCLFYC